MAARRAGGSTQLRLRALRQHLCPLPSDGGVGLEETRCSEGNPIRTAPTAAAGGSSRVQLLREYVSSGVVVLPPEELGIPVETHDRMYRIMCDRLKNKTLGSNLSYYEAVPALAHLFEAPGLVATLDSILGKDWAFVPFMHSMFVKAGDQDQGWHKDDNAIMNGRKLRHHRPMQVEVLYYPSDTDLTFGPTCVLPYSQYWIANNSESDPENFSGTDHLKFFANKSGGRWAALGEMDPDSRDAVLEASVTNLDWPLVDGNYEKCAVQCKAGTAVVMTNNTYHRGSRRRDDPQLWPDKPRVMWRMWAYRTQEPETDPNYEDSAFQLSGQGWSDVEDKLGVPVPTEASEVWNAMLAYSLGLPESVARGSGGMMDEEEDEDARLSALEWLLFSGGDPVTTEPNVPKEMVFSLFCRARVADVCEILIMMENDQPRRVGAAYALARMGAAGVEALERGLNDLREEVRRAACWGLSSPTLPAAIATPPLLRAATSTRAPTPLLAVNGTSVRKHAAFALGENGDPTEASCSVLRQLLLTDTSTWVRAAAAGALGCLGIRAAKAVGASASVIADAVEALRESLALEVNRDYSQPGSWNGSNNDLNNRAWDGSHQLIGDHPRIIDMCEGFGPLRSAVRENALWAMVMLSKHYAKLNTELVTPEKMQRTAASLAFIIQTDANGYSAGHAMDALRRIAAAALDARGDRGPLVHLQRAMAGPALKPCPESLLRTKLPWEEEQLMIETNGCRSDGASILSTSGGDDSGLMGDWDWGSDWDQLGSD